MLKRLFNKGAKEEDPLTQELKRLEQMRASLEEKSLALKEAIDSPHSYIRSARLANPSSSRHFSAQKRKASFDGENINELKVQTRAARNRFIISCFLLIFLGFAVYKIVVPLIF